MCESGDDSEDNIEISSDAFELEVLDDVQVCNEVINVLHGAYLSQAFLAASCRRALDWGIKGD